jgi:hypothetical protein
MEIAADAAGKERSARAGAEKPDIIASQALWCQGNHGRQPSLPSLQEKGPAEAGPCTRRDGPIR